MSKDSKHIFKDRGLLQSVYKKTMLGTQQKMTYTSSSKYTIEVFFLCQER